MHYSPWYEADGWMWMTFKSNAQYSDKVIYHMIIIVKNAFMLLFYGGLLFPYLYASLPYYTRKYFFY